MSQASAVAEHAATLDWNIVAAAVAVFCATFITTLVGWLTGKKKINARDETPMAIAGVSIQDNQTLRESTLINREIRDQLLLNHHAMTNLCRALEANTEVLEEIIRAMRSQRIHNDRQENQNKS